MNTIDLDNLTSSETPHLHTYDGGIETIVQLLAKSNYTNTRVDLGSVRSYGDFFKVMKDTFEYPEWFGDNANAFWDMLIGYGEPQQNNVIIFENVDELYRKSPETLDLLLESYKDAAIFWAIPNNKPGMEHGSVALSVVLHSQEYDLSYDQYVTEKAGTLYVDRLMTTSPWSKDSALYK